MEQICWWWREGGGIIGKNAHHPSFHTIAQIKELRKQEETALETLIKGTSVETPNEVKINLWQSTDSDFLLADWKALSLASGSTNTNRR